MQTSELDGVERALVLADPALLASHLEADPTATTSEAVGLAPLLVVLRRSTGSPADVRGCVRLLLDAGADPDSHTIELDGQGQMSALFDAVERGDLALVRLLIERGADLHDCAFDTEGPTPLDCAVWGLQNNRAEDGDYAGTVEALLSAGAPTRSVPPSDDDAVDALLVSYAAIR